MNKAQLASLFAFIKILPTLPKRWLINIISIQEKKHYNFYVVLIFAGFVGILRYTLEFMLAHKNFLSLNVSLVQHLVFYLHCIFIYTLILRLFIASLSWKQIVPLVLIGVFLGIFPPVLDVLLYGVGEFKYGYVVKFEEDWSWLIYNLDAKVPLGEASVLFTTIFFVAVVVYVKTHSLIKTLLSLLLAYGAVFFYGGILPLVADFVFQYMQSDFVFSANVTALSVSNLGGFSKPIQVSLFQLLLCLIIYFILNPVLFFGLLRRLNHAIPVVLTCLLGFSVYQPLDAYAVMMALCMLFAALVVIVQNDFFDIDEDKKQGRNNYVNKDDVAFFNSLFAILIILFIFSGNFSGYMLLLFFLVSILYNYDIYRGKKYFPTNYKIEGIAGLSAYLAGVAMMISTHYALSGDALNVDQFARIKDYGSVLPQLYNEVWTADYLWIAFFVFGGWSILSVIKDYKDIESDQHVGNQTAYTLLLKKGVSIQKFHKLYTAALSLSMFIPLFWLNNSGAHIAFKILLVLLTLGFFITINGSPNKQTVARGLGLANFYLLNLVVAFHLSH